FSLTLLTVLSNSRIASSMVTENVTVMARITMVSIMPTEIFLFIVGPPVSLAASAGCCPAWTRPAAPPARCRRCAGTACAYPFSYFHSASLYGIKKCSDGDIAARVDPAGVGLALPHLEVEVVAGGVAGGTHIADNVPLFDVGALLCGDAAHMAVQGGIGLAVAHGAVVDDDVVAVAAGAPPGHRDVAAGGRVDGGAARGGKVDAAVQL